MRNYLIAGLVASALCACGGGGGTSTPAPTVAASAKPVTIDMEGDSLIWGYLYTGPNGFVQSVDNPPAVVQSILQQSMGPTVTTQNNAVPGTTIEDSLSGTNGFSVPFATRLSTNPAQIVLTDDAVNDSTLSTVDQYEAELTQWIADVRAAGKIPVLEEPNPTCGSAGPNVPTFVAAMDSIAVQQGVLLIAQYQYILSLPNWQSMMQPDCVHPTDALYLIKAQREAAALQPVVAQLMSAG